MKQLLNLIMLLALMACSPENEKVQDEHVQIEPQEEALDTIASTAKDAVKTDEKIVSPTLPLPPALLQALAEKYPDWQHPTIITDAAMQAVEHTQSPSIARGDFNGDGMQDVALQLQKGENVIVVTAIQQQGDTYQLSELMHDILFNERGKLKSLYYLYRIAQGETIENIQNGTKLELPYDAIAVSVGKETTVYLYQNGSFKSFAMIEGEE